MRERACTVEEAAARRDEVATQVATALAPPLSTRDSDDSLDVAMSSVYIHSTRRQGHSFSPLDD